MAEEAEKDPVETTELDAEKEGGKEGKEPAESNLRGELERRKEAQKKAEQELADLREKILEFEDRDKSELQRAQERATRAETQLADLGNKVTSLEKGAWVRSAAAEFKFHDPEDAVVNLTRDLGNFEDQREARRAVERLARAKPHLTQKEKEDKRPTIGQVLRNGQAPADEKAASTPAQQAAQRELDFAEALAKELGDRKSSWSSFGGS